jgi:hypothetical protein
VVWEFEEQIILAIKCHVSTVLKYHSSRKQSHIQQVPLPPPIFIVDGRPFIVANEEEEEGGLKR